MTRKYTANQLLSSVLAIMLALSSVITIMTQAPLVSADHIDGTPEVIAVSPPYGYITTQPILGPPANELISDQFVEILHTARIDDSQATITMQVNPTGNDASPAINPLAIYNEIDGAATEWENLVGADTTAPDFSGTVRNDSGVASMFGDAALCDYSGIDGPNGIWEVAQCEAGEGFAGQAELNPSIATMGANGGYDREIVEGDFIIDDDRSTATQIRETARHEFGHMFFLGDLYQLYNADDEACQDAGNEPPFNPLMCSGNNIDTGDVDGIYFLYPFREVMSIDEQFTNRASDIAVAYLDDTSDDDEPEMVTVYEDYDSAGDTGYVYARLNRDIDPTSYSSTSGASLELFSDPGTTYFEDMGAAFGDIDHDGCDGKSSSDTDCELNGGSGNPDLVVAWIDDVDDGKFLVYFDVEVVSPTQITWSSVTSERTINPVTSGYEGLDVLLMDFDSDGWKDELLTIMTDFDSTAGSDQVFFTWASLSTSGLDGTWQSVTDTNVNISDDVIGAGIVDDSRQYVLVSYERDELPADQEYMGYKVFDFTATGGWIQVTDTAKIMGMVPTDNISTALDAVGGDYIFFTGASQYPDYIAQWNDSNNNYFMVERDTRTNSHG